MQMTQRNPISIFETAVRNRVSTEPRTNPDYPQLIPGPKEPRGGNGWIQNTIVRLNGKEIGFIQTVNRNGVETTMTVGPKSSRPGIHIQFLVRQNDVENWTGKTFRGRRG